VKALIFDFDGTIADSFETLLAIFEEVTKRPEKLTTNELKELRGKSLKEVIKYLKIKRWQIPRLILKAKSSVAVKIVDIKPFPDMPEMLRQLSKDGYKLYIMSTNSSANIDKFLKRNKLDDCFTKVYGDIGLRSKSSALKKLMKKEKLKPDGCTYIGDEVRDIEAAKNAGITSVGVAWGFNYPEALESAKPDAIAKIPQDLIKILS
jgi:phosphoglycolate phosphatase